MHACIICLAVLSSLLNLIWGTSSVIGVEGTLEADSTDFPTVVIVLLGNGGPAATLKDKLGLELAPLPLNKINVSVP